jgi:putative DNA primase/helicase
MLSESVRRREACVKAAQWNAKLNVKCDNLDPNPWLLNVQNGTIDVLTGEFREHKQEEMITKIANVVYDPEADCPLWKQFIREIMNFKPDLVNFLQTAAGWALTGNT